MALRLTVVVSIVSVIDVVTGAALTARFSKLPPEADAIERVIELASTSTSSDGAGTAIEPTLAPAAMVIVLPLSSVTVTALCATAVSEAI